MPYSVETITSKGSEIFATLADQLPNHLVFTGCYAVKNAIDLATALNSGNILNDHYSGWSETDWLHTTNIEMSGVTTDTTNHVSNLMVYAQFKSGEITSHGSWDGDKLVRTFYLHGHLDTDPNTEYILAVASDSIQSRIPENNDIINFVEVRFSLTFTALDANSTITTASNNFYVTRSEYTTLSDRAVTTHIEGNSTVGENQTIYGQKTFEDLVIFGGFILPKNNNESSIGSTTNIFSQCYLSSLFANSLCPMTGGTDIEVGGNLYPSQSYGYDLGSGLYRWKDLYLDENIKFYNNSSFIEHTYTDSNNSTHNSYNSCSFSNGSSGTDWVISSSLNSSNIKNPTINYSSISTNTIYHSSTSEKEQLIKVVNFLDPQMEHVDPYIGSIEIKTTDDGTLVGDKSIITLTADNIFCNLQKDIKLSHSTSDSHEIILYDSDDNIYSGSPKYKSYVQGGESGLGGYTIRLEGIITTNQVLETRTRSGVVSNYIGSTKTSQAFIYAKEENERSQAAIYTQAHVPDNEHPEILFRVFFENGDDYNKALVFDYNGFYPETNNDVSLGTSQKKFSDIYANNLHLPPISLSSGSIVSVGTILFVRATKYSGSSVVTTAFNVNPGDILDGDSSTWDIKYASIIRHGTSGVDLDVPTSASNSLHGKFVALSGSIGNSPDYGYYDGSVFLLVMKTELGSSEL